MTRTKTGYFSKPTAWILPAVLIFLLPVTLLGQVTGTISGFVTDPTGAAVPEAKVEATLVLQNVTRTVESNPEGFYNFRALAPGEYTIAAEKDGFQRLVRSNISLTVNENVRVDLSLALGQVTQVVEVTSQAPLVDTTSGTVSGLVDDRRVVDLPLNGRNVIALAKTVPGVLNVRSPQHLATSRDGAIMNVNGAASTMNQFTFNGGYFSNASRNTGLNYPPPDAIQEFRILTQNFSAEYGRFGGSQVNLISKRGTNEFHGTLWEFLRNDNLNARNFFADRVPAQVQNQFGAAAGGPVVKDKLFVFGSWQRLRDRPESLAARANVPSAAERAGDFSALLPDKVLKNPVDPITGDPFINKNTGALCVVNNIIDPGCFSPAIRDHYLPLVPESPTGTFATLAPLERDVDTVMVRFDWNQSAKSNFFGHYYGDFNLRDQPVLSGGNIPNYQFRKDDTDAHMGTLSNTYTFSPTLLNEAAITFQRNTSLLDWGPTREPREVGINMDKYPAGGFLEVRTNNLRFRSGGLVVFTNNNWEARDSVSWIKGRHTMKFGGEWLHMHFRQIFLGDPSFRFNGARTGDDFADFLLGAYRSFGHGFGVRENDDFMDAVSLFWQDEFKINPRFTLTYGVRWEPFTPWVDRYDRLISPVGFATGAQSTRFPDAPPGLLWAGDPGIPRTILPKDWNNFGPRLGWAWDVFGDGKTSVRGSYGIFYDHIKADAYAQENAPFAGSISLSNGIIDDPYASVGREPPPVVPGADSFAKGNFPLPLRFRGISDTTRTAYIQHWNLTIERQLTAATMLRSSYIGKAALKIEGARNFNPAEFKPDPFTGDPPSLQNVDNRVIILPGTLTPRSDLIGSDFRSWYHSWQTELTRRFSNGLSFKGSYVLSKSIDTMSSNVFSFELPNPFDITSNRGRSDHDQRHAVVVSWLYSPNLGFTQPWQRFLLGGWTFSGITTIQSGAPLTFVTGEDVALDGTGNEQHARFKPNHGPLERNHANRGDMIAEFFNTDVFIPIDELLEIGLGTYGDSGRNILSGPAQTSTDFAVAKDFRFKERYRVQFRSEFFNLFNQVNLGDPETELSSGNFGQIRSAGAARVIQFALKFIW